MSVLAPMDSAPTGPVSRHLMGRADLIVAGVAAAVLAVLLVLAFQDLRPAQAAPSGVAVAELDGTQGAVRTRSNASLAWRPGADGRALGPGDGVFVPVGGAAIIRFEDGAILELEEQTLVVVGEPADKASDAPPVVELHKGGLVARAARTGLEVRAGGVAAVVGADGAAGVRRKTDGGTAVDAIVGTASLRDAKGRRSALGEGKKATVSTKGAIAVDERPVPSLTAPPAGHRLIFSGPKPAVTFRWTQPQGVTQCRLEMARSRDFAGAQTFDSAAQFVVRSDLAAGHHYWRVQCRDGSRAAISAVRTLSVTIDRPPVAYQPAEKADVLAPDGSTFLLAWTRLAGVTRYEVQLAGSASFAKPLLSAETSGPYYDVNRTLPEGSYCFRARGLADGGEGLLWTAPRCFNLLKQPRILAPKLLNATFEKKATLSEGPGAGGLP